VTRSVAVHCLVMLACGGPSATGAATEKPQPLCQRPAFDFVEDPVRDEGDVFTAHKKSSEDLCPPTPYKSRQ